MDAEVADPQTASRAEDALFRPVRATNAFEETVERVVQAIKLGLVSPGERLPPERELAVRLEVSRVTLREAIRALQQAGYVRSRRGRYGGTFVVGVPAQPSLRTARLLVRDMGDGLDDLLTLRHVLEVGAAEAAATRTLGAADRADLEAHLAATEAADLTAYRRVDSRFHLAIAELAGAPSVTSAVADARLRMNELLDAIPLLAPNLRHSNDQHTAIAAAVLDGDAAEARRLMAEHLAGTATLLRGFLA